MPAADESAPPALSSRLRDLASRWRSGTSEPVTGQDGGRSPTPHPRRSCRNRHCQAQVVTSVDYRSAVQERPCVHGPMPDCQPGAGHPGDDAWVWLRSRSQDHSRRHAPPAPAVAANMAKVVRHRYEGTKGQSTASARQKPASAAGTMTMPARSIRRGGDGMKWAERRKPVVITAKVTAPMKPAPGQPPPPASAIWAAKVAQDSANRFSARKTTSEMATTRPPIMSMRAKTSMGNRDRAAPPMMWGKDKGRAARRRLARPECRWCGPCRRGCPARPSRGTARRRSASCPGVCRSA